MSAPTVRGEAQTQGLLEMISHCVKWINEPFDMVEIGCYLGESTVLFLARPEIRYVTCVDIWDPKYFQEKYGHDGVDVEQEFEARVKPYWDKVVKLKLPSVEAAKQVLSKSLIYIDADHEYESVKADLVAWTPVMASGGIIAGHDYVAEYPGVIRAVDEAFKKPDMVFRDSSWIKYGPVF